MKNDETKETKPSRRRYIIAAVILMCILAGYIYAVWSIIFVSPEAKKYSEIAIRATVSRSLNSKEPNELTDEDFAKFTELKLKGFPLPASITAKEFKEELNRYTDDPLEQLTKRLVLSFRISDLSLLEKFTNLEELSLGSLPFPENETPELMKFLAKFGIIDLSRRNTIDLEPLTKLKNLKKLSISQSNVKSLKPLAKIKNLQSLTINKTLTSNIKYILKCKNLKELDISGEPVSNLDFIKKLKNLQTLNLESTKISDIEPLAELQNLETLYINHTMVSDISPLKGMKNLQRLEMPHTLISDLEPLRGLSNLQVLYIYNTAVSDIKLLKGLTNLQILYIKKCPNITDEQVDELQKTLPKLLIFRM